MLTKLSWHNIIKTDNTEKIKGRNNNPIEFDEKEDL